MAEPSAGVRTLLAVGATLVLPLVVLRVLAAVLPDNDSSRLLATAVAAGVFLLCVRETRRAVRDGRRSGEE